MKKQNGLKKKTEKEKLWLTVAFLLFSIIGIVFGVLCLKNANISFIKKYTALFSVLVGVFIVILFCCSIWFVFSKKETLTKSTLTIYILMVFVLIVLFVLQKTNFFEVVKDAEHLEQWLQKAGVWMPLAYIVLQYLQVVILPIPSFVSTAAGVALFGTLPAILFSLIGILLGSFTAFYIGRKLGSKAVAWLIGRETMITWQQKIKGKDNFFLTVMFLLPFFPDDVLCFIAGLSTMSDKYFLIMILITRLTTVTATSYTLQWIPLTEWWGILVWAILIIVVALAVVIIYKNLDKIQDYFTNRAQTRKKRK